MNAKTTKIIGWVLTALLGLAFIMSAATKIMGAQEAVDGFANMGMSDAERIGIGAVELLCILLFIVPRTGVLGTVLLIGYMGGTILAHITGHLPFVLNVIIGVVIGLTGWLTIS
jgi:hypothetical protein